MIIKRYISRSILKDIYIYIYVRDHRNQFTRQSLQILQGHAVHYILKMDSYPKISQPLWRMFRYLDGKNGVKANQRQFQPSEIVSVLKVEKGR